MSINSSYLEYRSFCFSDSKILATFLSSLLRKENRYQVRNKEKQNFNSIFFHSSRMKRYVDITDPVIYSHHPRRGLVGRSISYLSSSQFIPYGAIHRSGYRFIYSIRRKTDISDNK